MFQPRVSYDGIFNEMHKIDSFEQVSSEQQATPDTPIWLAFGDNAQAPEPLSFGLVAVGECLYVLFLFL